MLLAPPTVGKLLLALDPGGTTGIAVRSYDGSIMTSVATDAPTVWSYFSNPAPDAVIFELFSTMGRVDKYMLHTVEMVGGIKALCHALNVQGYAHVPQQRKAFIESAREILKGQRRKFMIHEVDALAHLLAHEYRLANPRVLAKVSISTKVRGL